MTLKLSSTRIKSACVAATLLVLGACTATEGMTDNPVLRKFQWFSYLEGGDFKAACTAGAPARYRMIYNAVYTEQVRVYDLNADTRNLDTQLILPMDIRDFSVEGFSDLLNPWRGQAGHVTLSPSDVDGLVNDLEAFGAFGAPNVGEELSSKGFFWTIAACHEGRYHFTGLSWPSPEWDGAAFSGRLFALDPNGVDINPPRVTDTTRTLQYAARNPRRKVQQYHLKVGEDGLAGVWTLF